MRPIGYNAWIVNTDNRPDVEKAAIESFRQRNVEGYVFATAHLKHPLLDELAAASTPMVLVNRRSNSSDIPSVTSDDAAGVALAMQHLVDLGHTKIVHLAGPQDLSTGVTRRRAFVSSLEDLGLPAESSRTIICEEWSELAGAKAHADPVGLGSGVHRGPRGQRPACPRRLRHAVRARSALSRMT